MNKNIMNKSYSKLKHIQEVNKRLENKILEEKKEVVNEQLTQYVGAAVGGGIAGTATMFGNWVANIFRGVGKKRMPALTGAFIKIKTWQKVLNGQLKASLTTLNVLWTDKQREFVNNKIEKMKNGNELQKSYAKDLEYQQNALLEIIKTYKNTITALIQINEVFDNENLEQFAGQDNDPAATTQSRFQQGASSALSNVTTQTTTQK